MFQRLFVSLLICAACAAAQSTAAQSAITVTASRTPNVQPDQAVFGVSINSDIFTTLDDVVAALQGSGIGLSNFSGVSTITQYVSDNQTQQNSLQWVFNVVVPLTSLKSETQALSALQQGLATAKSPLTLSFSLSGLQISPQLAQSQACSLSDLISDARAQANKIAGAAGQSVGAILSLSSAVSTVPAGSVTFSTGAGVPCSLTVKFATGGGF